MENLEFGRLVIVCKEKGIKVEPSDTRATLLEKLTTKPKREK